MIFETERLILRPWQESDADDLYRYASVTLDTVKSMVCFCCGKEEVGD